MSATDVNRGADEQGRRLWLNACDSLEHAIDHFDEIPCSKGLRDHHTKWAILSAAHAAECFCKALLLACRPEATLRGRRKRFSGLKNAIDALRALTPSPLHPSELSLLRLFAELARMRDEITHSTMPVVLDPSIAAMSALGIMRVARARFAASAQVQSRWIGRRHEVAPFEAIHSARIAEYCRNAARLLHDQYPSERFSWCPACETEGVRGHQCEVCFEDLRSVECPDAGMDVFYPAWQAGKFDQIAIDCPLCGGQHVVRP